MPADFTELYEDAKKDAIDAARAILSLAETAGMPASYQQTDRRMQLARSILRKYGVPNTDSPPLKPPKFVSEAQKQSVSCPKCLAPSGTACRARLPGSHLSTYPLTRAHEERRKAFLAEATPEES
jgi:hypothetical protein